MKQIRLSGVGCRLGFQSCNVLGYADDNALTHSSLQSLLDIAYNGLHELDLMLNFSKCQASVFNHNGDKFPKLTLGGNPIEYTESYKYLGIILNGTLTNKEDFARAEKSHLRQFFSFYRKFESCNEDIRVFLYNTYCHNMYGIELWDSSEKCKIQFKSLFNFFAFNSIFYRISKMSEAPNGVPTMVWKS